MATQYVVVTQRADGKIICVDGPMDVWKADEYQQALKRNLSARGLELSGLNG